MSIGNWVGLLLIGALVFACAGSSRAFHKRSRLRYERQMRLVAADEAAADDERNYRAAVRQLAGDDLEWVRRQTAPELVGKHAAAVTTRTPTEAPRVSGERTIADMRPGWDGWTVPWAMQLDEDGRGWINGSFPLTWRRQGTSTMLVVRKVNGYEVTLLEPYEFHAHDGRGIPLLTVGPPNYLLRYNSESHGK